MEHRPDQTPNIGQRFLNFGRTALNRIAIPYEAGGMAVNTARFAVESFVAGVGQHDGASAGALATVSLLCAARTIRDIRHIRRGETGLDFDGTQTLGRKVLEFTEGVTQVLVTGVTVIDAVKSDAHNPVLQKFDGVGASAAAERFIIDFTRDVRTEV